MLISGAIHSDPVLIFRCQQCGGLRCQRKAVSKKCTYTGGFVLNLHAIREASSARHAAETRLLVVLLVQALVVRQVTERREIIMVTKTIKRAQRVPASIVPAWTGAPQRRPLQAVHCRVPGARADNAVSG